MLVAERSTGALTHARAADLAALPRRRRRPRREHLAHPARRHPVRRRHGHRPPLDRPRRRPLGRGGAASRAVAGSRPHAGRPRAAHPAGRRRRSSASAARTRPRRRRTPRCGRRTSLTPVPLPAFLAGEGRPIRYGCTDTRVAHRRLPDGVRLAAAGRPRARLGRDALGGPAVHPGARRRAHRRRACVFAPITLHTGVSSLEAHEPPYAERYRVPAATARLVNEARTEGHRVIAVGTTATRALETDAVAGRAHAGDGWTELVITPERGLRGRRRDHQRLARARGQPPPPHGGRRRPPPARGQLPRSARRALPLARVRRHPPRGPVDPTASVCADRRYPVLGAHRSRQREVVSRGGWRRRRTRRPR